MFRMNASASIINSRPFPHVFVLHAPGPIWKMEQGDRLFNDNKDLEWLQGLSILSVISYRQGLH